MSFTESVLVAAPADKVRRQCAEPSFLARAFPGLTGVRRVGDGVFRCGLDFEGMPTDAEVRVEETGGRTRLRGAQPSYEILVDVAPQQQRRTDISIRVDFRPQTRTQHQQINRAVRDGLAQIKVFLETEPGVPESRRGERDPLLHTGPRVPPDTPR